MPPSRFSRPTLSAHVQLLPVAKVQIPRVVIAGGHGSDHGPKLGQVSVEFGNAT
jgi:hypothetical protein